ncbi:MAG: hypothetical protein ABFS19_05750 [Thermodesulfobacteriota bacterium]
MTDKWHLIGEEGLHYSGTMSASISHELKNVFAIINENSGLLQDLVMMQEKGMTLQPAQLQQVSELIRKQVKRGDLIIKTMNSFAHLTDTPTAAIEPRPFLDLACRLSQRLANMRRITVEVDHDSNPPPFTANPFLLANLLWRCLELSFEYVQPDSLITLRATTDDHKITLAICGLEPDRTSTTFFDQTTVLLAETINCSITAVIEQGAIHIDVNK